MKIERAHLINAAKIAGGYLVVFLLGKLLNQNPGLPIEEWLLDNSPLNHSYLFGWLIMHERYWKYSVVSIFSAMFGLSRFGWSTFAGFSTGLVLGELCGMLWTNSLQAGFFPYPWRIWFICLCISIVLGILLELRKKKK